MGYPKQPGDDAKAHRELAERHLATMQECAALTAENERLREGLREAREHIETLCDDECPLVERDEEYDKCPALAKIDALLAPQEPK